MRDAVPELRTAVDLGGSVVGRPEGNFAERACADGKHMRFRSMHTGEKTDRCGNKAKGTVVLGRIFRSSEISP